MGIAGIDCCTHQCSGLREGLAVGLVVSVAEGVGVGVDDCVWVDVEVGVWPETGAGGRSHSFYSGGTFVYHLLYRVPCVKFLWLPACHRG